MKTLYKNIAVFVGGTLFGSAGIKLLAARTQRTLHPRCRSCPSHEGLRYEHR